MPAEFVHSHLRACIEYISALYCKTEREKGPTVSVQGSSPLLLLGSGSGSHQFPGCSVFTVLSSLWCPLLDPRSESATAAAAGVQP